LGPNLQQEVKQMVDIRNNQEIMEHGMGSFGKTGMMLFITLLRLTIYTFWKETSMIKSWQYISWVARLLHKMPWE